MALPPPPPPPSAPYGGEWVTPPPAPGPWPPMGAHAYTSMPPPGQWTTEALRRIRDALGYYWIVLWLNLLAAGIASVVLGVWFGGSLGFLSSTGSSRLSAPLVSPGESLVVSALVGLAGLCVLILTIYAWWRWREAARDLRQAASEFGPAAGEAGRRAQADVSRTTYTFVASLVVAIVFAATIAALVLTAVIGSVRTNGTGTPVVPAVLTGDLLNEIRALTLLLVVVSAALTTLLYAFATRSHVNALAPFAAPDVRARIDRARQIAILGALLGFLGIVQPFVPYASVLGVVPAAVLIIGYHGLRRGFDEVLARPLAAQPTFPSADRLLF